MESRNHHKGGPGLFGWLPRFEAETDCMNHNVETQFSNVLRFRADLLEHG